MPTPDLTPDQKTELAGVIQRMQDAGEPDENIKSVVDHYVQTRAATPATTQTDQTSIGPPVSFGRKLLNAAIETGPQNVFKKENLPVIAAALTTPFTAGAGLIPTIAAAGLAGGAGEATRQAVSGEDPNAGQVVKQGAIQGALAGGGHIIGAGVEAAPAVFRESAEKNVAQALGATKEWAKSEAGKLAPQMLDRGVSGTRAGMLAQAERQVAAVGPKIEQAYTDAAAKGATIPGAVVRDGLQQTRTAFQVPDANGNITTIPGSERVVAQLNKLDKWVGTLGDNIPTDKAFQIRKAWDKIVDQAGLFGKKATASATDNADAWVYREARRSFQKLMNDVNPDIVGLNKEFSFWKGLKDVLTETHERTQAQGPSLLNEIAGSAIGGATAIGSHLSGLGYGESAGAGAMTGWATKQMVALMRSPYWRTTVSGPMKSALADALSMGNVTRINAIQKTIMSSLPSVAKTTLMRTPVQTLTPALAAQDSSTTQP